jgi:osmotically-inducible protein OsmY
VVSTLRLLAWTATIPAGINATVAGGWVTLEGTVGFRFQKQAAENAVRQLIGVRREVEDSARVALGVRNVIDEVRVQP